jgi:hypothetical protein
MSFLAAQISQIFAIQEKMCYQMPHLPFFDTTSHTKTENFCPLSTGFRLSKDADSGANAEAAIAATTRQRDQ